MSIIHRKRFEIGKGKIGRESEGRMQSKWGGRDTGLCIFCSTTETERDARSGKGRNGELIYSAGHWFFRWSPLVANISSRFDKLRNPKGIPGGVQRRAAGVGARGDKRERFDSIG